MLQSQSKYGITVDNFNEVDSTLVRARKLIAQAGTRAKQGRGRFINPFPNHLEE